MTRSSLQPSAAVPYETGVIVKGATDESRAGLLTGEALVFLGSLERRFGSRRRRLIQARAERQARLDAGTEILDFPAETAGIRAADWTVAPVPADLLDRRVEITGPAERKMIINALNSGAKAFMADLEDSSTPTWGNMIQGQVNLYDAVRRTIAFTDPASGKDYRLNDKTAVLIVRPRGWHMEEAHVLVDGTPISASLFDFGLFAFHNAAEQLRRGTGPYFYLPKMESRHEAALWRDVFDETEHLLDLPAGSIRATVLIETLPAAFEMDEILYELRDYAAGLNCGRWDYIFSMIKTLGARPDFILPDRAQVTMTSPALRAYSQLLIKTCHRRGAHAMGGMAAQIPVRGDEAANAAAYAKVLADKEREAGNGHDGTWVAHPGLVEVARTAFNAVMRGANQVGRQRDDVTVTAADLTRLPEGTVTEDGLRGNIRVGIQYLEAWLRGQGCVPLYNLMEDAATAEICRAQVWQWHRHAVLLDGARPLTTALLRQVMAEETAAFSGGQFDAARDLFLELCLAERLDPFLTLPAYGRLLAAE
jgi:malate synthase A